MTTLADLLAMAVGQSTPAPPRSRFPPEMLEAMGLGASRAGPADTARTRFPPNLLPEDQGSDVQPRSRFPAGMLESLGLGANRIR